MKFNEFINESKVAKNLYVYVDNELVPYARLTKSEIDSLPKTVVVKTHNLKSGVVENAATLDKKDGVYVVIDTFNFSKHIADDVVNFINK